METTLRFFRSCFFALFLTPVDAQFALESLNIPHGGGEADRIGNIGNTLWQTSSYGKLFYRSDDGGLTWVAVPYTFPSGLSATAIGHDGNLYVHSYSNKKTYRSSDGGISWESATAGQSYYIHQLIALPSGVLLGGTYDNLLRSTDHGATWETVAVLSDAYRAGFIYDNTSGKVYFSTRKNNASAILRSTDEGLTWQEIFTGDDIIDPPAFAVASDGTLFAGGREDGKIWRSQDDGATWEGIQVTNWWNNNDPAESIAITASGRIFCIFWYKTFYSDDGGNTWQPVDAGWGETVYGYKYIPGAGLFAEVQSLYRSTDEGANWQFAATGIHRGNVRDLAVTDDARFYAATDDGVFTTADSGATWNAIYLCGPEYYYWGDEVKVKTGPDGTLYLATADTLLRSTDAGASWVNIETPAPYDYYTNNFVVHPSSGTLYMSGYPDFYLSHDKGNTWELNPNGSTINVYDIQFAPDGTAYGRLGYQYLTVRTDDDFATWDTVPSPGWEYWPQIFAGNAGFLLALRYPKVYRSFDGGLSWDSIPISPAVFFSDKPVINNVNYIFGEAFWGVGYSVDFGQTWQVIDDDMSLYDPRFVFSPSQRLYVGDGLSLYRTTTSTSAAAILGGKVFDDPDVNCTPSPQESPQPGFIVRAKNDDREYFGTSNGAGRYLMPIEEGDWTVQVIPPNGLWVTCAESVSIPPASAQTYADSVHIGLRAGQLCPYMEVGISTVFLRRCFPGQYVVHYCNTGTVPAEDAYLEVELDDFFIFQDASLPAAQNGQLLTFQLGTLDAGQCGDVKIDFTVSCEAELGQLHCTRAHAYPDTICTETWNGSQLTLRAECLGDKARFDILNAGAAMPAPLDYAWHTSEGGSTVYGNFQLAAGQTSSVEVPVPADGAYIYFRHALENGYPFGTFRSAVVHGCPVGMSGEPSALAISGDVFEPFLAEDCRPNVGAFDPNDKQGFPAGIEDAHHIERGQKLSYLIRFQNTGTDTAFNVVVRDTLSPFLDPATAHLETLSHPGKMEWSGERNLAFYFYNILLPDSNINEAASHGFLRYSVNMREGVSDGTRIENRAGIYFDYNDPVMTNMTWHTVGMPFPVVGVHEAPSLAGVLAQPNPYREEIVFKALEADLQLAGLQFEMSDLLGRVVHLQTVSSTPFHCFPGKISSGQYLYKFSNDSGKVVAAGMIQKF